MSNNIHAFTEPHGSLPAYLNVRTAEEGLSTVSVRARGCQSTSGIVLTDTDLLQLARDILAHLHDEKRFDAAAAAVDAPQPAAPAPHITPTVGRVVWYRGADGEIRAAIVAAVNGEFNVNLLVLGSKAADMEAGYREGVTHADPEQEPSCFPSWHWMPYQKQQAAKHAAT